MFKHNIILFVLLLSSCKLIPEKKLHGHNLSFSNSLKDLDCNDKWNKPNFKTQCGKISLPLNHQKPSSQFLELSFIRYLSQSNNKKNKFILVESDDFITLNLEEHSKSIPEILDYNFIILQYRSLELPPDSKINCNILEDADPSSIKGECLSGEKDLIYKEVAMDQIQLLSILGINDFYIYGKNEGSLIAQIILHLQVPLSIEILGVILENPEPINYNFERLLAYKVPKIAKKDTKELPPALFINTDDPQSNYTSLVFNDFLYKTMITVKDSSIKSENVWTNECVLSGLEKFFTSPYTIDKNITTCPLK